jgi:adenylate cyclase
MRDVPPAEQLLQGLENCSPRTKAEEEIATHLQFKPMIRLACQTRVTGSVTVRRLVLDDEDEELAVKSMADQFVEAAGEEKYVAILFADIRGFTSFAERLLPYDVIHALNRYYYRMGQIVHRHGGVIDNYMGDGILSVFGIEGSNRMVSRALQAGLEMLEAAESMKPYFEGIHGRSFDIGIGLHYGAVVVGSIGWGNYKRRTIVGDAVNFASRVESANKNAGTNFLISEDAYEQVGHEVEVNQCPPWEVRGKTGVFQLYEVVGTKVP